MLVWAAGVLDDGGEPHDSGNEVSIAGQMGQLSGTETPVADIGSDSTAEDTGAATVDVDAAVGVLDVDNTGVEAIEQKKKNKVVIRKTFSRLNKMVLAAL